MDRPGLFDYPAVALDLIQAPLGAVLPDWLSIALWALLASAISMYLYGKLSQQEELAEIEPLRDDARKRLAAYDGPFEGLPPLIRENLSLSRRHLWLTFVPAMLSALPVLVILAWLSNSFGAYFPSAGTPVQVVVNSYTPHELQWRDSGHTGTAARLSATHWQLEWPAQGETLSLLDRDGRTLVKLPPPQPTSILHPRLWWNDLLANPGGYLDNGNNLIDLQLGLPEQEILPWGPDWARGWLPYFIALLFAFSLSFKRLWRLH